MEFEEGRTEYAMTLQLKKEPALIVMDSWGNEIQQHEVDSPSLTDAIVSADGYLSVPVRSVPGSHEAPFRDSLAVYLLSTADLPELRVEIQGPPADAEVFARIEVVNEESVASDSGPVADTRDFARLDDEWRRFYSTYALNEPEGQVVFDRANGRRFVEFHAVRGLRIYARGKVSVECFVKDYSPARGTLGLRHGRHERLVLAFSPQEWPRYEFELLDRYDREAAGPVYAWIGKFSVGTFRLGRNRIAVPPEFGRPGWFVRFTAEGLGSATLRLDHRSDLREIGRVEFAARDVYIRFVREDTGKKLTGADIQAEVGIREGRYRDGAFHFELVDPGARYVEIRRRAPGGGPAQGPPLRLPLDVSAASTEIVIQVPPEEGAR